jgi:hypothetical protein
LKVLILELLSRERDKVTCWPDNRKFVKSGRGGESQGDKYYMEIYKPGNTIISAGL